MILASGAAATAFAGVAILALGVATARPDVVALSVPILLTTLWGALTRPERAPSVGVRLAAGRSEIGEVRGHVRLGGAPGAEATVLRVSAQGYRARDALVLSGPPREVPVSLTTARTGVQRMFRVDAMTQSSGGVLTSPPSTAGPVEVAVHPVARPLRDLPLPFRLPGLTGTHTSRRVGDGYEVHDVHEFGPGDRLKRIDWRTSARRALDPRTGRLGTLYARRSFATADATVMVVVDSRDDVGQDVSTWAGGTDERMDATTSLDLAREAASSIARAYLEQGDRVGLDDLGRRRRPVPPAAGRHQAERIAQRLVRLAPEGWPGRRERAPQLPSGALVVLCSTFLDDEAARLARRWRTQGHRVVAVDTMPALSTFFLNSFQDTAFRLVMLERRQRLRSLTRSGVEIVAWTGQPETALPALARVRHRGARR